MFLRGGPCRPTLRPLPKPFPPNSCCTLVSDPDPDITTRLKTLESAVLAFTAQPNPPLGSAPRPRSAEVCRNFNVGRCRMPGCRYRHVCRVCGGPSPAMSCCEHQLGIRPADGSSRGLNQAPNQGPSQSEAARRFSYGQTTLAPGPDQGSRSRTGVLPY